MSGPRSRRTPSRRSRRRRGRSSPRRPTGARRMSSASPLSVSTTANSRTALPAVTCASQPGGRRAPSPARLSAVGGTRVAYVQRDAGGLDLDGHARQRRRRSAQLGGDFASSAARRSRGRSRCRTRRRDYRPDGSAGIPDSVAQIAQRAAGDQRRGGVGKGGERAQRSGGLGQQAGVVRFVTIGARVPSKSHVTSSRGVPAIGASARSSREVGRKHA